MRARVAVSATRATVSTMSTTARNGLGVARRYIGVDPGLIGGVRRALGLQGLAHLPVDPVAGQQGGDRLLERPRVCGGHEIVRIGEAIRGRVGGRGVGHGDSVVGEHLFVQPALFGQAVVGVGAQTPGPLGAWRASRRRVQRFGERPQIRGVLDDVEGERLRCERPVLHPPQKRVLEDGVVNVLVGLPELPAERLGLGLNRREDPDRNDDQGCDKRRRLTDRAGPAEITRWSDRHRVHSVLRRRTRSDVGSPSMINLVACLSDV